MLYGTQKACYLLVRWPRAAVVGHVLVASGVLPGYRGVWRSMHTRRGVGDDTARRLWPGWARRRLDGE